MASKSFASLSRSKADRAAGRITYESPDTVRKWGDAARLRREVEAMTFVREHASIPVPAIRETRLDDAENNCWILMERIPGRQLDAAWPNMTEELRTETIRQLRSHLSQLHQLRPSTAGFIGSVSGGSSYDHRLSSLHTCGPFTSVGEFHDFLVAPVRQCPRPEWANKYRAQLTDEYETRFCHADLSWENILVDISTGRVTGFLDWEMAGYWPEWWEYRKALFGGRSQRWWIDMMNQVMREYLKETVIDVDLEMY